MVKQDFDKIIRDFFEFFQVRVKSVTFSPSDMIPVVVLSDENKVLKGLRNVVEEVSSANNAEEVAVQDEWVEFMLSHRNHFDSNLLLKELNNHLMNKVFFVGNKIGPADILMYYFLYNVFLSLSFQEKEKYIHLSRWFNQIQQVRNAKLWRTTIPFSRCHLYA